MKRSTARTLAIGETFKLLVMWIGLIGVVVVGILDLTHGHVLRGILDIVVGIPVWLFVADIATGIIIVPFLLLAAMFGRKPA